MERLKFENCKDNPKTHFPRDKSFYCYIQNSWQSKKHAESTTNNIFKLRAEACTPTLGLLTHSSVHIMPLEEYLTNNNKKSKTINLFTGVSVQTW